MTIDFYKLTQILTPPVLRRPKLLELIRILIAKPLQGLHTDFAVWRESIRYKAALTPQTIALETMAKKLLDTTILISELDGKPFDFLVQVQGETDLNKLTKLINTYKLAGKSFTYVLSNTVYSCEFKQHVAEEVRERYQSRFIYHVAENDGVITISHELALSGNDVMLVVTSSEDVTADVTCYFEIQYLNTDTGEQYSNPMSVVIARGESMYDGIIDGMDASDIKYITVFENGLHPLRDGYYTYKYE